MAKLTIEPKGMKITYRSNNSGGTWRLKPKHWYALEKAGWHVYWWQPEPAAPFTEKEPTNGWLDALANVAHKEFESPSQAMREFEKTTGIDITEGCNCCGSPHAFTWEKDFASGAGCLPYLYEGKKGPTTLRQAWEKL